MSLANKSWGDEEFEEDTKDYETPVDENGIKYTYHFTTNEDGKKVRITRKIRVSKNVKKVNKRVEERRQRWKKFGKVAGVEGIEPGATTIPDTEVYLVLGDAEKLERERLEQEKKDKKELEELYNSLIAEGRRPVPLGGPSAPWRPTFGRPGTNPAPTTGVAGRVPTAGAYVPPHKVGRPYGVESTDEENTTTLRVTNLSDETTENDLSEMFRHFSPQRVYLVRDKENNTSRGFAFVTFSTRGIAQSAMNALNGTGWDHLILSIEWAKPSVK